MGKTTWNKNNARQAWTETKENLMWKPWSGISWGSKCKLLFQQNWKGQEGSRFSYWCNRFWDWHLLEQKITKTLWTQFFFIFMSKSISLWSSQSIFYAILMAQRGFNSSWLSLIKALFQELLWCVRFKQDLWMMIVVKMFNKI